MATLNRQQAANVIVEASLYGDAVTLQKYGLSKMTLWRYRKRLNDDPELLTLVSHKRETVEANWRMALIEQVYAATDYLKRAAQSGEVTHEMVRAVAGALKIAGSILVTQDAVSGRLPDSEYNRQTANAQDGRTAPGQ